MNTANTFPAARVMPHAAHAFGGIWRLTARRFFTPGYWLTLVGMMILLVVFSIPATQAPDAAAREFFPWAAGFYVCFVLPMFAFISAAGAIRDDFSAGTVDYVLTRPVRRRAFVVFRYFAQVGCTQIDFLFALAVVIGIGAYHGLEGLWSAVPVLLFAQVLAVFVFSAFGLLCGTLTSRYVIVGLAYAAIVEVGLSSVPTQINQISVIRQLLGILRPILGESDGALNRAAMTATLDPAGIAIVLVVLSTVLVAITALLFAWREFAGSGSRDA